MNDPEIPDDAVVPHVGIGCGNGEMIRLGMSKDEAKYLLGDNMTITVDFRGDPPGVAFIQAAKWWGTSSACTIWIRKSIGRRSTRITFPI